MEKGDDPYKILGVSSDATTDEIKKAYRKSALKNHPDKKKTEEEKKEACAVFAKIAGAYELLTDDFQRKEYDRQQEDTDEEDGFDGNAEYDYDDDYDYNPNTTTDETALVVPKKTGFFGRARGRKGGAGGAGAKGGKKKKKKPVKFSDPYEVFKKAFEDEFGVEYPGAKFDKKKVTKEQRQKKVLMLTDGETGSAGGGAATTTASGGGGDSKEKKGGILSIFRRGKKDQQLAVRKDEEGGEIVEAQPRQVEEDNKPVSMETKERKIVHPDGVVETITEMTITRPDGSTETMRRTDHPEYKTGNWNAPVKKSPKMLTNSNQTSPPKQLTNGTNATKTTKNNLAITSGDSKGTSSALVKKNATSTALVQKNAKGTALVKKK